MKPSNFKGGNSELTLTSFIKDQCLKTAAESAKRGLTLSFRNAIRAAELALSSYSINSENYGSSGGHLYSFQCQHILKDYQTVRNEQRLMLYGGLVLPEILFRQQVRLAGQSRLEFE